VQNIGASHAAGTCLPSECDLQLLFAQLNLTHFDGSVPAYRIAYNAKLTSVAGRITYRPPLIELSVHLLTAHPGHVEKTLLHEMVHAWLRRRRLPSGHGEHFKRKMREVGLPSIYHSLPVPGRRSARRYALACPRCKVEFVRRRLPGVPVSCARCSPKRFNRHVQMTVRKLV
jgi:predicted SprT family Zn-dependent metalloprotease